MGSQPTGTITFLFTDIEGSTRLWEEQEGAMENAVARHDEILHRAIDSHGGYIFTTAGDAFSAAFNNPLDALHAAIDAQTALVAEVWETGGLRVRMGLHVGVAQERDGDYFGPAVNRAARIMDAGHGGQVLLGKAAGDLLAGSLPDGAELKPLGTHRLKDLGSSEQLFQLRYGTLQSHFPDLRTLTSHVNNLPSELSSFVGRRNELNGTIGHLGNHRLVTLTGVGGSGKTRLALQTAAEVFERFPDGLWLAELANLTEPEELPRYLADELQLGTGPSSPGGGSGDQSSLGLITDFLASRTALLVLDNCEHVIAAVAEFSDLVLRACPRLTILATSREGLGVTGEQLIQVPSMRLPSVLGSEDGAGGYPDSMELFAERASAVSAGFELNPASAPAVAAICRRLDGMPLAIELAAARVRVLSPDQIASRLDDAFRLLTGGSRTALPRQQTLLATVDWSFQLLTEIERALFVRLAVFRGGFTLEATEAVVSGDGVESFEVLDVLTSLVEKSMIQGGFETERFTLLETLRQFALQKLIESGGAERWRERHAEFFADVADGAFDGTRSRDQIAWLERLDLDHENFQAAFTWAVENDQMEWAGRIGNGLTWFWGLRGHTGTGLDRLRVIDVEALPHPLRVSLLTMMCYLEMEGGSWTRSRECGEAAVVAARELGDPKLLSKALIYRSNIVGHLVGDFETAHSGYDEGFALSETIGDEWGMGWHLLNKGWTRRFEGHLEDAEALLVQAVARFRRHGIPAGLAWAVSGLGTVLLARADFEGAVELFDESIGLHTAIGNRGAVAFSLSAMAKAFSQLGRFDDALESAERGMELIRSLTKVGHWHFVLVRARREAGNLPGAVEALEQGRAEIEENLTEELVEAAEETARLLSSLGAPHAAVPLVAYADGERERTKYPVAAYDRARHEAFASELRVAVPNFSEVFAEWRQRGVLEVLPLLLEDIDLAGRLLRD